uniref:Uncharacterized protein n=1 Tax=Anguilla anguilla TaxID=7936 RepID=A0A0E9P702_ANGAN
MRRYKFNSCCTSRWKIPEYSLFTTCLYCLTILSWTGTSVTRVV